MHASSDARRPRGPAGALLDLFSSVRFGIVLLVLLFFYSSVGSAGILYPTSLNFFDLDNWNQIVPRQARWAEMTEFEWFHWWPFDVLIGLICLTLVVTTIRRIPFRLVNFGVWMIHTGIITLAIGSVWYFAAKVEGDAPVARRAVVIESPGAEPVRLLAQPGARASVGNGSDRVVLSIDDIDPDWEMLTGDAKGRRVYSVSVSVRTAQRTFIRQLLAGYPELTEDILPGQGRAVKVTGEKLVDPSISMRLELSPQRHFYLVHSDALYLREKGTTEWIERPIEWLPRYNDSVSSLDSVWLTTADSSPRTRALDIAVPPENSADPLARVTLTIDSYLRYAETRPHRVAGAGALDPFVSMRLVTDSGESSRLDLRAADQAEPGGLIAFEWINDESELAAKQAAEPGRLSIEVPESGSTLSVTPSELELDDPDRPFTAIAGTDYSYRVRVVDDSPRDPEGRPLPSVAVVDVRQGEAEFTRFVSNDPTRAQDNRTDPTTGRMEPVDLDDGIRIAYAGATTPRPITLVGGPREDQLRVVIADSAAGRTKTLAVAPGSPLSVFPAITLVVDQFLARSVEVVKPIIVPFEQRNRDADMRLRQVRVLLPGKDRPVPFWLEFHDYPFESPSDALRRFAYNPTVVKLSDGREIEMLFSRRRMELPAPVVLDDFALEEHVGGFTGSNISVRDWRSVVRFGSGDARSTPINVSINKPGEFEGYWFFQSMWDPPDPTRGPDLPASRGRNYTILGVGNREGVRVQLLGCAIAVMGMLYAFYIKPIIKRRAAAAVRARLREEPTADQEADATMQPVGAGGKASR